MSITSSKGTAVVTGASSGIGAIYADRLARRGYDLILVARNVARLQERAQRLAAETGRKVEVLAADLTKPADLRAVEARLREDAGITALVNNAGVGSATPLLEADVDAMDAMIQLNVTALTRLTHAAVPGMVRRGGGLVINIASIVGIAPELLNGTYGGTKAFVIAFTQSLYHELAGKGLRVQAVLPGATRTEFWDVAGVPVDNLPQEWVMPADEMVDASLAALDQGELITIPALPDVADWRAYEAARQGLKPNLSHSTAAARLKPAA
ncbi:MAG: SDR family oxidoreductase [Azospirillaceae bacterium]|nr:SDR family oxidoreductase [Azospirillaceae bacterium]